jgi:hypothetical protein
METTLEPTKTIVTDERLRTAALLQIFGSFQRHVLKHSPTRLKMGLERSYTLAIMEVCSTTTAIPQERMEIYQRRVSTGPAITVCDSCLIAPLWDVDAKIRQTALQCALLDG